ncbi:MAG: acyl-CoA dehydrogenase family protein [Alphaproteobacteria bacterium]
MAHTAERIAAPTGTHDEMLARTRALLPAIAARATECEQLRKVPRQTVEELVDAGIVNLLLPKRVGGSELDYVALIDVVGAVGTACASTSWVLANLISCNFMPCYWPEAAQDELWSKSANTLLAGSLIFAGGKAVRAAGGYRIGGRWPLVSGCDYADWLLLAATVEGEAGDGRFLMFLAPKQDYEIIDTWFASGLKGTGSNDVVMKECFVPTHRTLPAIETRGGDSLGARVNTGWLYRMPLFALFSTWVGTTVLGAAEGALDEFVAQTRRRVARISGGNMAGFGGVQLKLGEAASALSAARRLVYGNVRDAQAIVQAGGVPSLDEKLRYRADGAFAGELCVRAVDILHRMAGAGGLYESSTFARHFRDVHAGTSHITQNLDMNATLYAQHLLGLSPDVPLL